MEAAPKAEIESPPPARIEQPPEVRFALEAVMKVRHLLTNDEGLALSDALAAASETRDWTKYLRLAADTLHVAVDRGRTRAERDAPRDVGAREWLRSWWPKDYPPAEDLRWNSGISVPNPTSWSPPKWARSASA